MEKCLVSNVHACSTTKKISSTCGIRIESLELQLSNPLVLILNKRCFIAKRSEASNPETGVWVRPDIGYGRTKFPRRISTALGNPVRSGNLVRSY